MTDSMTDTAPARPHATDGSPCWCKPRLAVACYPCRLYGPPRPSCRECKGTGLVDAPKRSRLPLIVVHNEA